MMPIVRDQHRDEYRRPRAIVRSGGDRRWLALRDKPASNPTLRDALVRVGYDPSYLDIAEEDRDDADDHAAEN